MPTKDLEDYRRFTKPAELHSDMEVGSAEVTEALSCAEK